MAQNLPPSSLTPEQAVQILAPIGPVCITDITRAATTNDVFKVTTRAHGSYYVKFHTARWYADQPDTFFVVDREQAVCDLLRKRGMPLPFPAWVDMTRTVVPRSIFICGELPGISVPEALRQFPDQHDQILEALGRYLNRLHSIEFSRPGLLASAHAYFAPPTGPVPPVICWDRGEMHRPEHLQQAALNLLKEKSPFLPQEITDSLGCMFDSLADVIREDYVPPRFTVGNCHAWHFHVSQRDGQWDVLGFYDFEAVSAGDPTIDLVELEVTLTPVSTDVSWREAFFAGYGSWPKFDGYKARLCYYLLHNVGKDSTDQASGPSSMSRRWPMILAAKDWQTLDWYRG